MADLSSFLFSPIELMTSEIPWAREPTTFRIMTMVAMEGASLEVPPEADLPGGGFVGLSAYTALMRRCYAHEPAERPASFAAVLADLRAIPQQ